MNTPPPLRFWFYFILIGTILWGLSGCSLEKTPEIVVPVSIDTLQQNTNTPPVATTTKPATNTATVTPAVKEPIKQPVVSAALPSKLNLDAPFYSQAPFSDWGYPWQEACEEASMLLAANVYWKHNWTRAEFNDEILKMVEWEKKQFGTYLDTTVAQNARILNEYLGLKTITHENPTYDDLVTILNKGHFIVMFLAGKELQNPNFTNGGPIYHSILVKGYNGTSIITHDVGTRNGADYVYSWTKLQSAMHDFTVPIENGAKRFIEVLPPDEK